MNKGRFIFQILAVAVFMIAATSAAQAQATRTWVSGVGDDVNPCSRTAPCKTFAGAISKTAVNGEIDALDPGGFGTVTITKSITIEGTQGAGFGSILNAGTNGVNVNDSATATPNTIVVSLRNLSIQGAGTAFDGIRFIAGKELNVENCVIAGMKGNGLNSDGIDIALTANVSQRVNIVNTIIRDCTGEGIRVSNTAGAVNVVLQNTKISHVNNGISIGNGGRAIIKDSSFNNTTVGIAALAGSTGFDLESCLVQGNVTGIAIAAGTTRMSNCRITNNTNGINFVGGTLVTYGDNKFDGNTNEAIGGSIPAAILKK